MPSPKLYILCHTDDFKELDKYEHLIDENSATVSLNHIQFEEEIYWYPLYVLEKAKPRRNVCEMVLPKSETS